MATITTRTMVPGFHRGGWQGDFWQGDFKGLVDRGGRDFGLRVPIWTGAAKPLIFFGDSTGRVSSSEFTDEQ
ncbi:hypothetical protein [Rhodoplanes sp. Z2-YC6860]|uniref:hypothetical protein n=1 Tax=Rhodoplanes sp. Z2-YC6860 TaxID=674703 RepID=UPI0012EE05C3|nr:hypothetical protein [Rhodoplanes sp. Z2-YC6860]